MTKEVKVRGVSIGGGAPVTIQSMTNTKTSDAKATIAQIRALEEAGVEIVRVSVNDQAAASTIREIREATNLPLVADVHFDHKLAIASIENGVDKVRLNPSNVGSERAVESVVVAAKRHGVPIRVGVNGGSLEKSAKEAYGFGAKALAASALENVKLLEKFGFYDIVISAKCSSVQTNVEAYRLIAKQCDYPLHVGVTEAGGGEIALAKSFAGIGALLLDGIGDTIRVSLTGDPVDEVYAADHLLKAVGLRKNFVNVISCPTCARTEIDVAALSEKVREITKNVKKPYTVAVMGCVVNGVGEGSNADVGVAGGKERSAIFKSGKILKTVPNERILPELLALIEEDLRG